MDQERYSSARVDKEYFALYGSRERFYDQKKDMEYFQDQRPELWLSDSGSGPRLGRVLPRRNDPIKYGVGYEDGFLPDGAVVFWEASTREHGQRSLMRDRYHLGDKWTLLNGYYVSHPESLRYASGSASGILELRDFNLDVLNPSWPSIEAGLQGESKGEINMTFMRVDGRVPGGGKITLSAGSSAAYAVQFGGYTGSEGTKFRALFSGSGSLITGRLAYEDEYVGRWGQAEVSLELQGRFLALGGAGGVESEVGNRFRLKPISESSAVWGYRASPGIELRPNWQVIWSDINQTYSAWQKLIQEWR